MATKDLFCGYLQPPSATFLYTRLIMCFGVDTGKDSDRPEETYLIFRIEDVQAVLEKYRPLIPNEDILIVEQAMREMAEHPTLDHPMIIYRGVEAIVHYEFYQWVIHIEQHLEEENAEDGAITALPNAGGNKTHLN